MTRGELPRDAWRCCGCGAPAPDRHSGCDCPTGVVFRLEGEPRSARKSAPFERAILQIRRALAQHQGEAE